mgnify:CR=1 FL=1
MSGPGIFLGALMGGRNPLPEDFEYNSGTNPWFLTIDEMREMLDGIAI